jgi:myo-inositol 2-dehydrogenase/D-chiro-inositol 1-dehydrogenase/scyllo-inositol 2-dehydrogenase (NAD+)
MAGTHARSLARTGVLRVLHVVDPDPAAAAALADALGASPTGDLEAALDDVEVEAGLVATPAPTHPDLVRRVASTGRHVFVEKPLAVDLAGGRAAVEAVREAGVICQVGFMRRYDPAYADAKRRIEDGEIGTPEVLRLVSRDPAPPPLAFLRSSGGLMVDFAIHDLDLARFLFGPVAEVRAVGGALIVPELGREGMHDTAVATLRFESGALGTLEAGLRTGYGYEIRTEAIGSGGRLRVEVERQLAVTRADAHGVRFDPPRNFEERFGAAFEAELRAFARSVRGDAPCSPGAEDAWHSLRLALAAQRALHTGHPVDVAGLGTLAEPREEEA